MFMPETQFQPSKRFSVLLLFSYALDKPVGKNNYHQSHDNKHVVLQNFHVKFKEINHLHTSQVLEQIYRTQLFWTQKYYSINIKAFLRLI